MITDPVLQKMLEEGNKAAAEQEAARATQAKARIAAEQKRRKKLLDGYSLLIQRRYLDYIMESYNGQNMRAREVCDLLCIGKSTLLRYKKGETPMPFGDFIILAKRLGIQNVSYNDAFGGHEFPDFVINTSYDAEQLHDIIRPQLTKFKKECARAGIHQSELVDEITAFLLDLEEDECGKQALETYKKFREYRERNFLFGSLENLSSDNPDVDSDTMTQMEYVTESCKEGDLIG